MGQPTKIFDFTHFSGRNEGIERAWVQVANGSSFLYLKMEAAARLSATGVLYLHVHRLSRKCYVGVTVMRAGERWGRGVQYRKQRSFGAAIARHTWDNFDSYILAFLDDRESMIQAERAAIQAAGGHGSKHTYNLTPGGDLVADNAKPIVGVNLKTGETRSFKGGAEAARVLGLPNVDMPMAVARKERTSVRDWWFHFVDDPDAKPPLTWGESLRVRRIRESFGRAVVAVHHGTQETKAFATLSEAAAALDLDQSQISQVVTGKNKSAGEWWFRYADQERSRPEMFGSALTRAKRDRTVYATHLQRRETLAFRNCTVADRELGLHAGAAASVASRDRVSTGDWWFSYDLNAEPPALYRGALVAEARSIAVIARRLSDGEETRYPSAKAAAAVLGMSRAAISKNIKGELKTAKGYIFRRA